MKIIISIKFLLISLISFSQTTGTITDARDGKVYKTVVIGNQTWMAENLNVSTFRNGDPIPEAKTNEEWIKALDEGKPAWCFYKNSMRIGYKYGKLYNFYAVYDKRGLSPEGWHIAYEWIELEKKLGGEKVISGHIAGKKLHDNWGWFGKKGTNESGFTALPGGYRSGLGFFHDFKRGAFWWNINSDVIENQIKNNEINKGQSYRTLNNLYGIIEVYRSNDWGMGLSVRCVKD